MRLPTHLSDLLEQTPQHGEMGMPVWMIGCFELPSQPPAEPPQHQISCCVRYCTDMTVWWTARWGISCLDQATHQPIAGGAQVLQLVLPYLRDSASLVVLISRSFPSTSSNICPISLAQVCIA